MLSSTHIKNTLTDLRDCQRQGEKVVFTNGCFDVLHIGHVKLLKKAKMLGARLVVGLNMDESVEVLKGPSRPINKWCDRAEVLSELKCVDYVWGFEDLTPFELIKLVRPNIIVKGGDWNKDEVAGGEFIKSYGGEVVIVQSGSDETTTKILDKMSENGKRGAKAGEALRKRFARGGQLGDLLRRGLIRNVPSYSEHGGFVGGRPLDCYGVNTDPIKLTGKIDPGMTEEINLNKFAPINPEDGEPYFTILSAGWGGEFKAGETIPFGLAHGGLIHGPADGKSICVEGSYYEVSPEAIERYGTKVLDKIHGPDFKEQLSKLVIPNAEAKKELVYNVVSNDWDSCEPGPAPELKTEDDNEVGTPNLQSIKCY